MQHLSFLQPGRWLAHRAMPLCLALLGWLPATKTQAQAPAWNLATTGSIDQRLGSASINATTLDDTNNVFVTGNFSGQVSFGGTTLVSPYGQDIFIAKYVPSTNTWAWAQRGGGTGYDTGTAIAVSGSSVYVVGSFVSSSSNTNGVYFGGTTPTNSPSVQYGAGAGQSQDIILAKYTDNGSSGTFNWTQAAGGNGTDVGAGLAVSGSSIYVVGTIVNNLTNTNGVLLGSSGSTSGTTVQNGTSPTLSNDLLIAKYTDNGATSTLTWTQVAGGSGSDVGNGIALSGNKLYLTGAITNTLANGNGVVFGGSGTTAGTVPQYGTSTASTRDLLLASYTDQGAAATLNWTQVGGGLGDDYGQGVAVQGSSVYVVGDISNSNTDANSVRFGGAGTTAGTVAQYGATTFAGPDLLLAKYTDLGTSAAFGWAQVGGGTSLDTGQAVAVSGSSVYVTGTIWNEQTNFFNVVFGGSGTTLGTVALPGISGLGSPDIVVAKYTDNGPSGTLGWTQLAGGRLNDYVYGLAVRGTRLYVAGSTDSYAAAFGAAAGAPVQGINTVQGVLAQLDDAGAAGTWAAVATPFTGGINSITASATDASGNVFVTGSYIGQVLFGSTLLSSAGTQDIFVAKYVPATRTWAWAQSVGGIGFDYGGGIAVSGNRVYITGAIINTTGNAYGVVLGGTSATTGTATQAGASAGNSYDLLLAKYTDNGSSATFNWSQVGGGTGSDQGYAVAVRGSSVYVAGAVFNTLADANGVVFGGAGSTAGTVPQYGASATASRDLLVAKYTDNGATATFNWSQVGGGTGTDEAYGIALNGANVYLTGSLFNSQTNASAVLFGGAGTTPGTAPQYGAGSFPGYDIVVAKYLDNGPTATLGWTQVGGGSGVDMGFGIATSGNNVYVTGSLINPAPNVNGVTFGGSGATPGTLPQYGASSSPYPDLVVAKYVDNGSSASVGWTQVAGGNLNDTGYAIAASGSSVYVAGYLTNNFTNTNNVVFGGAGTTPGTLPQLGASSTSSQDVVVAKYTDNGPTAAVSWTRVGGGPNDDRGQALALSTTGIYVAGYVRPAATFGSVALSNPPDGTTSFLGGLDAAGILATAPGTALGNAVGLRLYPNPAPGAATLSGATPSAAVGVFDALGRCVATATANGRGAAALPGGLAPGLYVVRVGAGAVRWVVE